MKIRVILLSFHSSGKIPVDMDVSEITVMECEITLALVLRSLLEMLSRPVVFFLKVYWEDEKLWTRWLFL